MDNKFIRRTLLLCLLILTQAACQKKESGGKICSCPKKERNWLYVNFHVEPPTPDFRKTSSSTTSVLSEMIFEGLMKVERDGSLQPAQAKEVEISSDGLVYTFYIRDAYWSDGRPVKAQDFASTWLESLDPNFPSVYTYLFYCIKNAQAAKEGRCPLSDVGIRVEGDKKLIVELENPTSHFLCLTTSAWYFPIRLPKEGITGHLEQGDLVSNGPFMVQKWHPAHEITIVKNLYYRCAKDILLDGIHISLIIDENTAAELFENGEFDLLGMPFSPIPDDLVKTLARKNKIASVPVGGVTVCCFNTTRVPFNNPKVRRAFSRAIDRNQLVEVFCPSAYAPAFTLVPSVFLPAISANPTRIREEEIEASRRDFEEGMAELGFTKDSLPEVQLNYTQSKGNILVQKLAEVMQQDWKNVLGVDVKLQGLESQSVIKRMMSKEYDSSLVTWTANYQDPMCFLDKFLTLTSPKNYPGWFHPGYNEAIASANASLDLKKRAEYLWQAERIFEQETPCAPLFHWGFPIVVHPRVQGLSLSPAASLDFTSLKVVAHDKKEHKKIVSANK